MSDKTTPLVQEEAWYLSIIGVLPAFQGRGLGAGLVENVLACTDPAGIPTYLETFTPRTISFYNRLGYRVVDCFKEPRTEANYWVMVRDAQAD
jgi:GNAT superfamily N-acetyltransferase